VSALASASAATLHTHHSSATSPLLRLPAGAHAPTAFAQAPLASAYRPFAHVAQWLLSS